MSSQSSAKVELLEPREDNTFKVEFQNYDPYTFWRKEELSYL